VAAETDSLEAVAKKISEQIVAKPDVPAKMFNDGFLAAVSVTKLAEIEKSLFDKYGRVTQVIAPHDATATHGVFTFRFGAVEMPVTLTIEADASHRISGLWFGPPTHWLKSWPELIARLAKLPGDVSFNAVRLDDGKTLVAHQPDKALGVGSAFKLYVLATLVDQKTPWDKIVRLEDRHKSLPSGVLLNWPDGAPLTVHTLATEMISISDNTAADTLLALAGREEVERRLESFGMKNPDANMPFLSTREFFRLKSNAVLRKEYLSASGAERRKLLARMDEMPRLKPADLFWNGPIAVDRIEWFASSADLCRVLGWLDAHGGETALAILAVNSGKAMPADRFAYVGYKGGSESGVLSMSWLLHARDRRHCAMSVIWNDKKEVDLAELVSLMSAAGELIAENESAAKAK
jgi:beta-lactamase class A